MKYIKKPVPIEAVQIKDEIHTLAEWDQIMPKWFMDSAGTSIRPDPNNCGVYVTTPIGEMHVPWNGYIVRDENGLLYSYSKEMFEKNFEVYNG